MALYAGVESNKDFFTSALHNLIISCTAVPNSPDKAFLPVYITIDVLPHAYIDVYMFMHL